MGTNGANGVIFRFIPLKQITPQKDIGIGASFRGLKEGKIRGLMRGVFWFYAKNDVKLGGEFQGITMI